MPGPGLNHDRGAGGELLGTSERIACTLNHDHRHGDREFSGAAARWLARRVEWEGEGKDRVCTDLLSRAQRDSGTGTATANDQAISGPNPSGEYIEPTFIQDRWTRGNAFAGHSPWHLNSHDINGEVGSMAREPSEVRRVDTSAGAMGQHQRGSCICRSVKVQSRITMSSGDAENVGHSRVSDSSANGTGSMSCSPLLRTTLTAVDTG